MNYRSSHECTYAAHLGLEKGFLPNKGVITGQPEDSEHDEQVMLAQVALLEVRAGAAGMPCHCHCVHCTDKPTSLC